MEELYLDIQLVSFPLIFVFGLFFMLDPAPKDVYRNHVLARKLFGLTMLIWSAYIGMTYLCSGVFENTILSISVNLSRFYIFGSLLEITFSALVDNQYPIIRKTRNRLILWCVYMALMALNVLFVPETYQWYLIIAAAAYYAYEVYAILRRYFSVYRNMRKKMDNYYSENVDSFTQWMLTSSYGLGVIGYSAIGLAFAPTIGLLLFMVAGVLFFNYMSYSLYRYTMSVGHIKEVVMTPDSEICDENHLAKQQPPIHEDQNPIYITLNVKINTWIENHGYIQPLLTIQQLATELETNRTYLSAYINSKYSLTFRDWIAKLRIDYAKEMLIKNPHLTIARIAQKVGYSNSSFTAMFIKLHGMSPAQWKRDNIK